MTHWTVRRAARFACMMVLPLSSLVKPTGESLPDLLLFAAVLASGGFIMVVFLQGFLAVVRRHCFATAGAPVPRILWAEIAFGWFVLVWSNLQIHPSDLINPKAIQSYAPFMVSK